ncbi:hypothetical protein [Microcystis aeruginosa]|uniref:Uncharacterized protein n=1 Tax=Microcystis aeruginosa PCC 9443 TaxID=1160281 RepID=I4G327_MICAE|nr:hypothetical protein [Microcystis aeruginosa]CCI02338.1 membrane hypothetical protein [Microcystis aeruginosa PCC 9443]
MSNTGENRNPDSEQKSMPSVPAPPEEAVVPNFFDKFFIAVTAFGFGLGTAIALLPNVIPLPIIPSIFFGTGIGALVYRFMGGFKDNDSLQTQAIKISGSLASLLSSIVVINLLLEGQLKQYIAEHIELKKGDQNIYYIEIENKGIKIGKLNQEDFNSNGYYDINNVSIVSAISRLASTSKEGYNHPVLERIRIECARNQGICQPNKNQFTLIIHSIKPETELPGGSAIGCLNSDAFWIGNEDLYIYQTSDKVDKIRIEKFGQCLDEEGQDKKVIISQKDADHLNLKPGVKIKARFQ